MAHLARDGPRVPELSATRTGRRAAAPALDVEWHHHRPTGLRHPYSTTTQATARARRGGEGWSLMFSSSSASMDAAAARRLLCGRRRMFDSASWSMAATGDSTPPARARRHLSSAAANRLSQPSSRGALPTRPRPSSHDQTWSPCNGVHFAITPASKARQASRSTRTTSRPLPTTALPQRPGGADHTDLMDSLHRISSQTLNAEGGLLQQNEALQAQLAQEKTAHSATRKALADARDALKQAETVRQRVQRETDALAAERTSQFEAQMLEMQRQHDATVQGQQRMYEERARKKQDEFDEKFHKLDEEAYRRAKKDVEIDLEQTRASAEQSLRHAKLKEDQIVADAAESSRVRAETLKFLHEKTLENTDHLAKAKEKIGKEARREVAERWAKAEEVRSARFHAELRKLKDASESRRHERADYESYRAVWRQMATDAGILSDNLQSIQDLVGRRATLWREIVRNFRPEAIEAWFPQRYPRITGGIQQMLKAKLEEAEQSERDLEDQRARLEEEKEAVQGSGHASRTLTRHLHLKTIHTPMEAIRLCGQLLNEHPLVSQRDELDRDIRATERQIALTIPGVRRAQLENARIHLLKNCLAVGSYITAISSLRDLETLRAVSQSAPWIREAFLRPFAFKYAIQQGDRAWTGLSRQRRGALAIDKTGDGINRSERQQVVEVRSALKTRLQNIERSIRMRQVLQESIGEPISDSEQAELDKTLSEEIARADAESKVKAQEAMRFQRLASSASTRRALVRPFHPFSQPHRSGSSMLESQRDFDQKFKELNKQLARATYETGRRQIRKEREELVRRFKQWEERQQRPSTKHGEVSNATSAQDEKNAAEAAEPGKSYASKYALVGHPAGTATTKPSVQAGRARARNGIRKHRSRPKPSAGRKTPLTARDITRSPAAGKSAGLNIRPTNPQQTARVFWPTFPKLAVITDRVESVDSNMDTFDIGRRVEHDASANTKQISSQHSTDSGDTHFSSQAISSHPVDSSYRPSESSDGSSQVSQSVESGGSESESEGDTDSMIDNLPDLDYHMSRTDHRNALMASPSTVAAYWTYKLYKNSEKKAPLVYYCTNFEKAETRAQEFMNEAVIGFDIEWEMRHTPGKSGIKKNVSLIQIAADDKIALFHLAVFVGDTIEELMPPSLRKILESRDVVKAGVNVQGDAWRLNECLNVKMTGVFELSHLYRVVMFSDTPKQINRRPLKLADQVQNVLLLPLRKDAVRTSAWSKRLDMQQTEYAASDAYAGFRLFHALEAKRRTMDPMPRRPAFYEEHKPIQLGDGTLIQAKTRKKIAAGDGKSAMDTDDDDENEEFFDAVENLDAYDLGGESSKAAGVPLAGLSITYPTLPSIEDQIEGPFTKLIIPNASDDSTRKEKPAPKKQGPPKSEQVAEAEQWVAQWRESRPETYIVKATHAQLRAYALWHQQGLKCKDVAALLRETPLALQTVATHVLEALRHENLDYDVEQLRNVLNILPPSTHRRYGKIVQAIGEAE